MPIHRIAGSRNQYYTKFNTKSFPQPKCKMAFKITKTWAYATFKDYNALCFCIILDGSQTLLLLATNLSSRLFRNKQNYRYLETPQTKGFPYLALCLNSYNIACIFDTIHIFFQNIHSIFVN